MFQEFMEGGKKNLACVLKVHLTTLVICQSILTQTLLASRCFKSYSTQGVPGFLET